MQEQTIQFPGSKPHYETLDGLRGMAAISIVVFHFFEFIFPDYKDSPLGHGYLAVDFFFLLSGFVIGYAYDSRMQTMGMGSFFRNRLIRLHPMVIFGTVLGLIEYIITPFNNSVQSAGWGNIFLSFVCHLLLVPLAILPNRGDGVFPLNSPSWSLSTEYIANIFYALVLSRVSRKILILLLAASGVWLVYVARQRGWLIMGWEGKFYFDGWARTAFSFTAGLAIYRFNLVIKNNINIILLLLLLVGIFMFPHFDNDWLAESLLVMVACPLIIALAAGSNISGRLKNFCVFTGRLSYPLYMTHICIVWSFGNYYMAYKPQGLQLWLIVLALLAVIFVIAYVVMRFYDEPFRKYLVNKWVRKQP
ncbi:acyltransferase family protein [Foetidibacter luteolus]|uniref:acyltransferase family protein n=1 Tax=Foetidibacter luteolus TaxID=2608880 RepID=UPI00129BC176|nr:acyltransferase [Foetidibacter luteolus]